MILIYHLNFNLLALNHPFFSISFSETNRISQNFPLNVEDTETYKCRIKKL